jgi:curli biogenesis system outer membrane secretion channel CsgG
MKHTLTLATLSLAALLAGCETTAMKPGGGASNLVTSGAAAGGNAAGANAGLERCASPLGTVSLVENQSAGWYTILRDEYRLPPTAQLLRMMIQQSNCFIVVERSAAGMQAMNRERELMAAGDLRTQSNLGKGQMVASDYGLSPEVIFNNSNAGGLGGALGGLLGSRGQTFAALGGALQTKEASTMLTMVDNRSGVQVAVSQGSASKTDFAGFGRIFGGSAGAGLGGYTNTEQGKVIAAAFSDAYNQMVIALRNYKAQSVQGQGLGGGGKLSVDGAAPPAQTSAPANAVPGKLKKKVK